MQVNEAYFNSKEFKELLNRYEMGTKAGEKPFLDVDDLVDIADYYNFKDRGDEAMEVIDFALEMYPGATLPNVFMARDALANMDFDKAREYMGLIEDHDDPDYHYLEAEIMIAEGNVEKADEYLREYFKDIEPDEYEDFIKDCANLYIDYGQTDKAYEWIMRTKGDDSEDFKDLMGRILVALGKFKDSERIFNELLDANPYDTKYWKTLSSVQLLAQDFSGALTSIEYALAIDPDDVEGLFCKANALLRLENFEEAVKTFRKFLEHRPDDAVGLMDLGICLCSAGRYEESLETLQKVADLGIASNEILQQIYQEMSFCYSKMGMADKAEEMINKAEPYFDDHNEFLVTKGHIMMENGKLDETEEAWREAMTASDYSPEVLLRVIVSMYDNQMVDAAYEALVKYCELLDQCPEVPRNGYSYMALCCHDMGHQDEFLKYIKMAADNNPKEAKMVLGFLFPADLEVKDYYQYMSDKLGL